MEVVRISGLEFSYGGMFSVRAGSLAVGGGEVLTLLGPNGSGKTTLLKCINALLKPSSGSIAICGKDIREYSRNELSRAIGYVPQSHTPSFPFTVIDVVLMGRVSYLSIFQQPSKADYRKAEEALSTVGISAMRDRTYTNISGGERQLVLIARAIAQEPKLLLLDEPTAHLDFRNQVTTLKTVRRLSREKGIGVVMSLHDPNHALMYSDRIALMRGGEILHMGDPGDIINEGTIEEVYGIPVEMIEHNGREFVLPKV
ncbi:MAG: ABC transporter ATP-binding protein [Candidatus Methanosuratincola sp.]|jgi:iron complex transport system ATP-binding protein|nr:ABC transporter ATP-binding protein [Candidatus Methanosuratincola sp.]